MESDLSHLDRSLFASSRMFRNIQSSPPLLFRASVHPLTKQILLHNNENVKHSLANINIKYLKLLSVFNLLIKSLLHKEWDWRYVCQSSLTWKHDWTVATSQKLSISNITWPRSLLISSLKMVFSDWQHLSNKPYDVRGHNFHNLSHVVSKIFVKEIKLEKFEGWNLKCTNKAFTPCCLTSLMQFSERTTSM